MYVLVNHHEISFYIYLYFFFTKIWHTKWNIAFHKDNIDIQKLWIFEHLSLQQICNILISWAMFKPTTIDFWGTLFFYTHECSDPFENFNELYSRINHLTLLRLVVMQTHTILNLMLGGFHGLKLFSLDPLLFTWRTLIDH